MSAPSLRALRLDSGRTIRKQADEIGVLPHVLRYAEQGGRPRPEQAKLIANFYGFTVTQLWPLADGPAKAA